MVDPKWILAGGELAFLLALASKPTLFRWAFFGSYLYLNSQTILYYPPSSAFAAVSVGCSTFMDAIRLFDSLCLDDMQLVGQSIPTNSLDLWSRIKWAIQFRGSPRGIGWKHEPTHALPSAPPNESRLEFVLRMMKRIFWGILFLDLIGILSLYEPPEHLGISQVWFYFRRVLQHWTSTYFGLSTVHALISIIFVLLRLSLPSEWPPLVGSLSDAYTVKRFWGRTWHQLLRKPLTSPWRVLAKRLGIKSGTRIHYHFLVWGAFFVSGVAHQIGDFTLTHRVRTGAIGLFLLQAVAISIEDIVLAVVGKMGLNFSDKKIVIRWKWLGYIWVYCWLAPKIWYHPEIEEGVVFGWWSISPILGLYRGEWFPRKKVVV